MLEPRPIIYRGQHSQSFFFVVNKLNFPLSISFCFPSLPLKKNDRNWQTLMPTGKKKYWKTGRNCKCRPLNPQFFILTVRPLGIPKCNHKVYCIHLNTKQVWYSNGPNASSCQMVWISNGGLKTGQKCLFYGLKWQIFKSSV